MRLAEQHGLAGFGHIAEPLVITQPPVLVNIDDERKAIESASAPAPAMSMPKYMRRNLGVIRYVTTISSSPLFPS